MGVHGADVENGVPYKEKWRVFDRISDFLYVMVRNVHDVVSHAPFFVHRFTFLCPHFLGDAEKYNKICADTSTLTTTPEKLRYHRYHKGLLQREVAEAVGIDRTNYSAYEADERDYYPPEVLQRLAGLFGIDVSELLDGYNAFLQDGQAAQLRAYRKSLGLMQSEFAAQYGYNLHQIKAWEQGRIRMLKKHWLRIFGALG
ncbi:MAG: helix-turn-helix domain-containing protein [Defluviitaleaceae bacterium]|nr:helix-turn-helix domain-containing protein [Defluviitaleaceae bacterium]